MIKAIIFDLGGVIVPLDFPKGYAALAKICPYDADEIKRRILATNLVDQLEIGRVAPEEFARTMGRAVGLEASYEEFRDVWSEIFLPGTLIPESLLEALHASYRLLLLSNTNAVHFPYIQEHYPLLRHMDELLLSYELGLMKPDPRIYAEAVTRAGCRPAECFFTDDLEANVEAARQAGIDAVRFESAEQLARELLRRGVKVS